MSAACLSRLLALYAHVHSPLTDHHQLSLTLEILGTPSLDDFYAITSTRSRDYIRALPFRKRRNFAQMFPNANPLAVDLMVSSNPACMRLIVPLLMHKMR